MLYSSGCPSRERDEAMETVLDMRQIAHWEMVSESTSVTVSVVGGSGCVELYTFSYT